MFRLIKIVPLLVATLAMPALALPGSGPRPAKPSESVWRPAPTPKGGTSWAVLESTKEIKQPAANGAARSRPAFSPAVTALNGKRVRVSGYMMPLQSGREQTHFVLLAYPPDCPFHLNPGPAQFIEVKAPAPVPFSYDVITIEGNLQLTGQDGSEIFYKIQNGQAFQ